MSKLFARWGESTDFVHVQRHFFAWRPCHKFNNAIWNKTVVNTNFKAVQK